MSNVTRRILVVAPRDPVASTIVERLARHGWACQVVNRLTEARAALCENEYEVVLAAERISDGRGYELTEVVAGLSSSLLIGVTLSDSYLWLPAVERGVRTLGIRAINPAMLEEFMEDLLPRSLPAAAAEAAPLANLPVGGPLLRHKDAMPPRRKTAGMR